ncbi:hypothetical protein D3C84_885170 [compost metagenome]
MLLLQFLEEFQIEINLPIARAIERTAAGTGVTTGRDHAIVVKRQFGMWIVPSRLGKDLFPGVFGVAQHRLNKRQLQVLYGLNR